MDETHPQSHDDNLSEPIDPERSRMYYQDDLRAFKSMAARVIDIDKQTWNETAPPGWQAHNPISTNPLRPEHLLITALRNKGYQIVLVNNYVNSIGKPVNDVLNVYVSPEDNKSVWELSWSPLNDSLSREGGPMSIVRAGSNGMLSSYSVNERRIYGTYEVPEEDLTLLKRAFLYSVLIRSVYQRSPENGHEDFDLYEKLRSEGVRPFELEEIVGVLTHYFNDVIEERPELKPHNKKEETFE